MSSNIEIEVKVLLTESDFNKVKKVMKAEDFPVVVQTNYYIDTPRGQLRKYGMALRIRELADKYSLTLKCPLAEGLLEKNQNLSEHDFVRLRDEGVFPEGDLKVFLLSLGIKIEKLKVLTSLTTKRISRAYQECLFSMDESHYSGAIDYELEMEGTSVANAEVQLREVCAKAGVKFVLNEKSKQARALEQLKKSK